MAKVRTQQGLTLIELIISILVIGIALAGVLSVMNLTVMRSADPMIQHQALAIAEAYLEEILTKEYDDTNCPVGSGSSRETYCAVEHYHNLSDSGAHDQEGNPIPTLTSYDVAVNVTNESINGETMKRIDVTVSHPSGINLQLTGYRADF